MIEYYKFRINEFSKVIVNAQRLTATMNWLYKLYDYSWCYIFIYQCITGDISWVQQLYSIDPYQIYMTDIMGDNAIINAAKAGKNDIVAYLLSVNPDLLYSASPYWGNIFNIACATDNIELVKMIHCLDNRLYLQPPPNQIYTGLDYAIFANATNIISWYTSKAKVMKSSL